MTKWIFIWAFAALGCSQNFSDQEPAAAMAERGFTARSPTPASASGQASGQTGVGTAQRGGSQGLGGSAAVQFHAGWPNTACPGPAGEATLGIFFFGPGQGGSVEANIERWFGQFAQEDGQPAQGRRWTRQVGDIEISGVDVSGTFSGGMGMGSAEPQAGYRMLGAIAVHRLGHGVFQDDWTGPDRRAMGR